jgi:hypothetical protein
MSVQQTYRLTGNVGEMNKLVNRRVEVTGTVASQSATQSGAGASGTGAGGSTPGAAGSQTPAGTPSGSGSTGSAAGGANRPTGERVAGDMQKMSGEVPRLQVTSIREVTGGPSCTPAGRP